MTANLTTANAPAFQPAIPWAPVPVGPIEAAGQPFEIDLDACQPANEVAAACEPVVPRPSRADRYRSELDELEAEADAFVERELDAQDGAITRELSDWHYDPWAPDADDWKYFIDHAAWVRSHTVTDRIVERLTCELDSVEESFYNQVECVGFVLGHDESACISWLDRSTAPYLRYLSARAGAVVDLIDSKYLEYIGANRLDAVRERALKLSRDAAAEADCVDEECKYEPLF